MRIRDRSEQTEDPPNLMPLIDMVFLLLIFFLVATTFAEEERNENIHLTRASSGESLSSSSNDLIINITREGKREIAGKLYDKEALTELLATHLQDNPDKRIYLRCDAKAFHEYFTQTAVLCQKVGAGQVKIGFVPQKAEK
jgi:biopolymer transport protein ExbD